MRVTLLALLGALLALVAVAAASELQAQALAEVEVGFDAEELALAEMQADSDVDAAFEEQLESELGAETLSLLEADSEAEKKPKAKASKAKAGKKAQKKKKAKAEAEEEDSPLPPKRTSGAGGIYRGGKPPKLREPNMYKGEPDGSVLPPWDPFKIQRRHQRREDRRNARRQAKADEQNRIATCRQMRARAKARAEAEAREAAEEKAELAKEKARQDAQGNQKETQLLEVDVDEASLVDLEAEADLESADAAEAEAAADAEEEALDLAELEADITEGAEVDVEAEGEGESEGESEVIPDSYTAMVEAESQAPPVLLPTPGITYNREELSQEQFDNDDSRAVFKRRARGQEIVRFQKRLTSSGGIAVNGVSKLPCGREVTDKGLFAPVVKANPGHTVDAADPDAPRLIDDSIHAVFKLPVVPEYHAEGGVDEYGDEIKP